MSTSTKIKTWAKHNVPVIIAGALGAASVVTMIALLAVLRPALLAKVEAQSKARLDEIKKASQYSISLPPNDPGQDLVQDARIPSQALGKKYETYIQTSASASRQLEATISSRNELFHNDPKWLIHEKVLPENNGIDRATIGQRANDTYLKMLADPLMDFNKMDDAARKEISMVSEGGTPVPFLGGMPFLYGGSPLSPAKLQEIANDSAKRQAEVLGGGNLTEPQLKQIKSEAQKAVSAALQSHASGIKMYVDPNLLSNDALPWPRQAGTASYQMEPIFESQMEIWILRDVLLALAKANGSADSTKNVLNTPVKRLLSLRVLRDGYVGLQSTGVSQHPASASTSLASTSPLAGSGPAAPANFTAFSPPAFTLLPSGSPQVRNFFVAPTGHMSNAIYDVRHVQLDVYVDLAQIDQLFSAITQTNLMSVVDCAVSNVDLFRDVRTGGYYYGSDAHVVRVALTLETLWLRSWTQRFMPATVKTYLQAN